jgi:hypothetical protein
MRGEGEEFREIREFWSWRGMGIPGEPIFSGSSLFCMGNA